MSVRWLPLLALLGCSAASQPDGPVDSDQLPAGNCWADCFPKATCEAGVVTVDQGTAIRCEDFHGCPANVLKTYTCERGCAVGREYEYYTDVMHEPSRLCAEGAPKHAGDPCTTEADCLPTPARQNRDGTHTVTNIYLRCNVAQGLCENAPEPVVEDWLQACGPSAIASLGDFPGYGFLEDASCGEGVCAFARDWDHGCMAHGCTRHCQGDQDCPQGAICIESKDASTDRPGNDIGKVCKLGDQGSVGVGLTCHD